MIGRGVLLTGSVCLFFGVVAAGGATVSMWKPVVESSDHGLEKATAVVALEWADLRAGGAEALLPHSITSAIPEVASGLHKPTGQEPTGAPWPRADPNGMRGELDGRRVALVGYMVPIDVQGGETRTFLLAPYVGACVHVPAPPPNQIVLVRAAEPVKARLMWDPFQAVGTLNVERIDTGVAEVGYTMDVERMEPYVASPEKRT